MSERLASRCHQSSSLVTELHQKQHNALIHLSHQITGNFTRGGKLICAGQGLLHTVAQHMAACFTHQLSFERPMLPAVALGDPLLATSLLASGQAHEYLAREYRLYRGEDHLLILFSTALPSVEIKHLAEQVEDDQNLVVIGPEGASKLLSKSAASQPLLLPGESLPRLIELALLSTHLLCELVEGELFGVWATLMLVITQACRLALPLLWEQGRSSVAVIGQKVLTEKFNVSYNQQVFLRMLKAWLPEPFEKTHGAALDPLLREHFDLEFSLPDLKFLLPEGSP